MQRPDRLDRALPFPGPSAETGQPAASARARPGQVQQAACGDPADTSGPLTVLMGSPTTCHSCCLTEENRLHTWEETEGTLNRALRPPQGAGGREQAPAFIVHPGNTHVGIAHLRNAQCRGVESRGPFASAQGLMSACSASRRTSSRLDEEGLIDATQCCAVVGEQRDGRGVELWFCTRCLRTASSCARAGWVGSPCPFSLCLR